MKKHDYLSRRQIQKMHDLSGDRNARRVLTNLKPSVASFRIETGENVYHLTKVGRERVGCEVVRSKSLQANHYIMRADAFLHYKGSEDWKNEIKVSVADVVTIIPDSYFRYNQMRHFLEVDHLQHMSKNREKIEKYRKLKETGAVQKNIGYFPRLVWVTLTEARKKQLLELSTGLDVVVHVWNDLK